MRLAPLLVTVTAFGFFALPAQAWFVGNGGDAVLCHGGHPGAFDGYFSYDYLTTNDGHRDHYLDPANLDASLDAIQTKLQAASPELGASLADFIAQIYNTSHIKTRIWEVAPNGLNKIPDDQNIAKLPPECLSGQDIEVVQAVVRQPPWVSGLPPDKILYNYVPEVTEGLNLHEPLQLSFLMVHEWLWDYTADLRVVQSVVEYLHRKDFLTSTPQTVVAELRGRGLSASPLARLGQARLAMTGDHACFIKDDTSLECWGTNEGGQTNNPTDLRRPYLLAAGYLETCAADETGVTCWGFEPYSALAEGVSAIALSGYDGFAHRNSVCYVYEGGKVACSNADLSSRIPPDVQDFVSLAMTPDGFVCGLTRSSRVLCWGLNGANAGMVPALTHPTAILSTNDRAFCSPDGELLKCWGYTTSDTNLVPKLNDGDPVRAIRGAFWSFCGFNRVVGRLWCASVDNNSSLVTDVPHLRNVDELQISPLGACVVVDNKVACWGGTGPAVERLPADLKL